MKWLDSFTLLMKANLTTLREKIEQPERMLNQLLVDMEEELERVRECVADAIADEIQTGKELERTRKEAQLWVDRAAESLESGDETSARKALEQKIAAEDRAASLAEEYDKQRNETLRLERSVRDLEDRIRQARQKRTLLLARMARAESAQKIDRALGRVDGRSAFRQFTRLEERVERVEAKEEAWDRLDGRDPDAEKLDREFAARERREKGDRASDDLRDRKDDDETSDA